MPDSVGSGSDKVPHEEFIAKTDTALNRVIGLTSTGYVRKSNLYVLKQESIETRETTALSVGDEPQIAVGAELINEPTVIDGISENDLRTEARLKGYEGDGCGECGNFTMVRNGTCLKCDTCGSTSGCS